MLRARTLCFSTLTVTGLYVCRSLFFFARLYFESVREPYSIKKSIEPSLLIELILVLILMVKLVPESLDLLLNKVGKFVVFWISGEHNQ